MSLAIALGREPPHHDDPPEGPDSFLADHGFEYIDGERTRYPEKITSASASASEENGEDNVDEDDVQGLSRVVDALSTIMWPTMVRNNNIVSGKRESELRPSLFDFDDGDDVLLAADDDEEATLAALMEADAVDQGAPQTRTSRVRREMQALERWLVENEELHEREFGGADGDDDDDDGDEDREHEHDDSCGDAPSSSPPPPSVRVSAASAAPGLHAAPIDDPWTAFSPTPTSTQTPTQSTSLASHTISITTAARSSGFDDDFSAFVSAPVVSIAGDDTGDDDLGVGGGYEALDDVDIDDGDPRPSISGQRSDDRAASLGDVPFNLPVILNALQTIREDVAGIKDEAERRATTARFASEFVYKRLGVDDGDGQEKDG